MVSNMCHRTLGSCGHLCSITGDQIRPVFKPDPHVDPVCGTEGNNFHVVSIGPTLGHLLEMGLEGPVNVLGAGGIFGVTGREPPRVFPFRVPADPSARPYVYEGLEIIPLCTHVLDDTCTDLRMVRLVAVNLV